MAYVEFDQHKIYYETHGEGEPLVILNGIMMSTKSWQLFLPELKDFKVILLDFIDQGASSELHGEYHHDIQVDCVKHVLDDLNIKQAYVVGISYGAQIALQFSIKYKSMVKRQVIFNAGAYTNEWLTDIGRAWQGAARMYDPLHFYNVAIPYVYSPYFYNQNYEWMNARKELLMSVFTKPFLDRMDRLIFSSESYDIRNELKDIDCPTLIVSADLDYITPMSEGVDLHNGIKNSEVVILKQCGHASMYEKPNDFVTLVKGFLKISGNLSVI